MNEVRKSIVSELMESAQLKKVKVEQLGEIAAMTIRVLSDSTPRIQGIHITIGHILCRLVEEKLFGQEAGG